jgi:hypothetical protein
MTEVHPVTVSRMKESSCSSHFQSERKVPPASPSKTNEGPPAAVCKIKKGHPAAASTMKVGHPAAAYERGSPCSSIKNER